MPQLNFLVLTAPTTRVSKSSFGISFSALVTALSLSPVEEIDLRFRNKHVGSNSADCGMPFHQPTFGIHVHFRRSFLRFRVIMNNNVKRRVWETMNEHKHALKPLHA